MSPEAAALFGLGVGYMVGMIIALIWDKWDRRP